MDQLPDPDLLGRLHPDDRILPGEIGERRRVEVHLGRRLAVECRLANMATAFVRAADFETAICAILEQAGELIGAQRAYLCRLRARGTRIDAVQEWRAPGVPPLGPAWQNMAGERIPWLLSRMLAREVVCIPDVASLPAEAAREREIFTSQGITSCITFPLFHEGALEGWFGCAGPGCGSDGDDRHALEVIAALVGGALQREILLETLEQRVADRTHDLAALFDMTMLVSQSPDVSDMLEPAMGRIMEIARCQAVSIHLLSENRERGPHLHLLAERGFPVAGRAGFHGLWPDERFAAWLGRISDPILASDLASAPDVPPGLLVPGYRAYLGAQMRARGVPQGILSCYRTGAMPFSWADVSILTALAEQLGVIVENQRLRRDTEAMAVVEERQRLARELHDAVTQSLYSLTLFARSAAQAAEDRDSDRLNDNLAQLEESGLSALREMRLLLYQLQPLALEDEGLVEALDRRFNSVERRLGVQVEYSFAGQPALPENVEAEVYRIAVEALNNALRHAGATMLRVCLLSDEGPFRLSVADNGCGFDVAGAGAGMGLENMRERARRLGGRLDIASLPGCGTEIRLEIPAERT